MERKRDYYEVLGVSRGSDREAIRKAFRGLAYEFHPDVSEDPEAEARFCEIAEAYEVLSKPEAREQYDSFGHSGPGINFSSVNFDHLFDHIDLRTPRPRRGADLDLSIDVQFVDAYRGAIRVLELLVEETCPSCSGEGAAPGCTPQVCPRCSGYGRVREESSTRSGRWIRMQTCSECAGAGCVVSDPCTECEGGGRIEATHTLLARIPPRTKDGYRIHLAGEGHAGVAGGRGGDAHVTVRVAPVPDSRLLRVVATVGAVYGIVFFVIVLLSS